MFEWDYFDYFVKGWAIHVKDRRFSKELNSSMSYEEVIELMLLDTIPSNLSVDFVLSRLEWDIGLKERLMDPEVAGKVEEVSSLGLSNVAFLYDDMKEVTRVTLPPEVNIKMYNELPNNRMGFDLQNLANAMAVVALVAPTKFVKFAKALKAKLAYKHALVDTKVEPFERPVDSEKILSPIYDRCRDGGLHTFLTELYERFPHYRKDLFANLGLCPNSLGSSTMSVSNSDKVALDLGMMILDAKNHHFTVPFFRKVKTTFEWTKNKVGVSECDRVIGIFESLYGGQ